MNTAKLASGTIILVQGRHGRGAEFLRVLKVGLVMVLTTKPDGTSHWVWPSEIIRRARRWEGNVAFHATGAGVILPGHATEAGALLPGRMRLLLQRGPA